MSKPEGHTDGGMRELRILVADDNVDAAATMAALLQLSGHRVETAHDGEQAIRVAESLRPNVALLDFSMPKVNGAVVARAIRDSEWGKSTLIVAISGWNPKDIQKRGNTDMFDAHLIKPVDFDSLVSLIRAMPATED